MNRWLSIIGIGEDGYDALPPVARTLIDDAELVVGGKRHLAMLPNGNSERLAWASPIQDAAANITQHRGNPTCVLATGDPFCYGIGRLISNHVPIDEINVIPAPSAFTLACARLGWSFDEVDFITLHGRPDALLEPAIQPNAKLLILAEGADTPLEVARRLTERGFGDSDLTLLERMGNDEEARETAKAREWTKADSDPLHVIAVDCIAGPEADCLSRLACLPDEAFAHDGQLTKQEVRAVSLTALAPAPGQVLWDVGAGCGSISIEWMRRDKRAHAIAIEGDKKRRALLGENALKLGVPNLEIVAGEAPTALKALEAPDTIFIGGGITQDGVFDACWHVLPGGGRLVANAVTLESEQALASLQEEYGGDLTRIAISRAQPIGGKTGWKPFMPVTQWRVTKASGKGQA
ncbi:MAG: cobalamin biosynthesis bifunctional protein CbiET [Rhodospirillaceae bacterium]|nr:cobalamin biosynthesis bifunctional protein CbiET [Rhodospirillaceae bacterium]